MLWSDAGWGHPCPPAHLHTLVVQNWFLTCRSKAIVGKHPAGSVQDRDLTELMIKTARAIQRSEGRRDSERTFPQDLLCASPYMRSLCELCLHPCCSVIRQSQNFPSFTSSVFSRGERCSRQPKLDHSYHTKWAPRLPPIFAAVTWIWCCKHTVEGGQVIYSVNANCNECGFGVEAKIHSRPPHNMNGSSR